MKKRRPAPGLKEKEPDPNALDARMLNPAREPVLPDVLETAATTADLNEEFVPSSAPLDEKPPAGKRTSASRAAQSTAKPKAKPEKRAEFFNPSTPLEEKPEKFSAVHTRTQRNQKSRTPLPAPSRKPARRNSR